MADLSSGFESLVGVVVGSIQSGDISSADDTFLSIIGYSREDFERDGLNWRELTPPKLAHLDEAMQQARTTSPGGGFGPAYQKALTRKDGVHVPVLLVPAFVPGTSGEADRWTAHVVALASPVEHSWPSRTRPGDQRTTPDAPSSPQPEEFRARLISELVRERARMAAMLDSTEALIWAVDHESRLIAANATYQAMQRLASGRETVVGERLHAPHQDAEPLEGWQRVYKRALAGERFLTRTTLDLPGLRLHFENAVSPIIDGHGSSERVAGVAIVAHEISKRVDVEEALRASEARFRTLASASPMGVFLSDLSGDNLYSNPRLAKIFDLEVAEMSGSGWHRRVHPADLDHVVREIARSVKDGTDFELEYRLAIPGVGERHVHCWVAPILEGGQVRGHVGCVQDETERHALAFRTRQREKMESLGTLAGGIAHDFNNMLAVVFCHVEIALEEAPQDASFRRSLEAIQTAAHRARDLVKQVLSFSRKSELPDALVELNALVHEAVSLLRASLPAGVQLDVRTPSDPIVVQGEATALKQVLVNLCTNAAHAMNQRGTISIALEATNLPPDGEAVLSVSDTGCGMTSQLQSRIFEPFFTTRRVGEGTGMGLAVVHGLVTAHGGAISVDSAPDAGSTFRVSFPLVRGAPNEVEPVRKTPALTRRGRVLLVEDEPGVAFGATMMLKRAGYDVTHANNGIEALQLFSAEPNTADIVLSDLAMPGLTGDKLAQAIHIVRPGLPIVLMSGFSDPLRAADLDKLGVVALLPKPWTSAELVDVIRRALQTGAPPAKSV